MTITTTFYKTVAVLSALLMAVAGFSFAKSGQLPRGSYVSATVTDWNVNAWKGS